MQYHHLIQHPNVFYVVTGLRITEFDELVANGGATLCSNGARAVDAA